MLISYDFDNILNIHNLNFKILNYFVIFPVLYLEPKYIIVFIIYASILKPNL